MPRLREARLLDELGLLVRAKSWAGNDGVGLLTIEISNRKSDSYSATYESSEDVEPLGNLVLKSVEDLDGG